MSQCPKSHLSIPALALKVGQSRRNLQRMAENGLIPGVSRTAGGHWRVKNDATLDGWLKSRTFEKMSRETLSKGRARPIQNAVFQLAQRLNTAIDFVNAASREMPKESVFLEVMAMEGHLLALRPRMDEALAALDKYKEDFGLMLFMSSSVANSQSSGLNG